jgi:hypothetical protein
LLLAAIKRYIHVNLQTQTLGVDNLCRRFRARPGTIAGGDR